MDIECGECLRRISRTNKRALAKTLRSLPELTDAHAALIAHAKTLADLIDTVPYETRIHSEYREVVKRLLEAGAKPDGEDAWGELARRFAALTPDSPVVEGTPA